MQNEMFPELLAPAGSIDAFYAAIAAGADAVYVGLGAFNARAGNAGLTLDELALGCAVAHAHGARVYVALNVFVRDAELDEALALARRALAAGADAFIVADAGLCLHLREHVPGIELHLSTQAGAQCAEAAAFAARELGVERVTCARELSVDELADLCATGVPIEAFCHGAICICYSGACSYSALLRGRSANRGDCVQPCRLAYELQDASGRVLAGGAWERGAARDGGFEGDRLLCPRDFLGIRQIPAMLAAGAASFKIEGRMKGPDYVYNVVRCYRTALDAACDGRALGEDEVAALEAQLARSFSRGFTDGYLRGGHAATGAGLMSFERAINQGLCVGELVDLGYDEVSIGLTRDVAAGDQLEIRSTPGSDAPADVPKRWPIVVCPRDVAAGERLVVHCKRKVVLGSAVHVVRSAGVIAEAEVAVAAMRAEAALLAPGVGRAGGDRGVADCDAEAGRGGAGAAHEPGAGCGLEVGHGTGAGDRLRADARAEAVVARGVPDRRAAPSAAAYGLERADSGYNECHVGAQTLAKSRLALKEGGGGRGPQRRERCRPEPPRHETDICDVGEVCRREDVARVRRACETGRPVLCRNVGQIACAVEASVPWEAAPPFAVWNARTARWLLGLGARRVWMPEELLGEAVDALASELGRLAGPEAAARLEPTRLGATPLMITEHCLLTVEGPCSGACATCARRAASQAGDRYLVELDRKSGHQRLRVEVDALGRTRLYR